MKVVFSNCSFFRTVQIKDNEEKMIAFIIGIALGVTIGVTVTLIVLEDADKL